MTGSLEQATALGSTALAFVYLELIVGLALVATVLHFRRRLGTSGELEAVRRYFRAFFLLLLALPCLLVLLVSPQPAATLEAFGWTLGRAGRGLTLTFVLLPLAALFGYIGSRDELMRAMYPLAKAACADARTFASYELSYFFLYYVPWEFVFRGALFLPLVPAVGLVPALIVQTVLATLLHYGHPWPEVLLAALTGPPLGLVAYATGSFLYPLVIHATAGIVLDSILCRRLRRP